jgi:hypothetical protein
MTPMTRILLTVVWGTLLAAPAIAQDHTDVVANAKAALVATGVNLSGACGAFAITKVVAWQLRGEGAGLLDKPGGNNCDGYATDIIAFPSGRIVDILVSGGDVNGPSWQDAGTVDPSRYRPAMAPAAAPPPPVVVPPEPPAPIFDTAALETQIANLRADVDAGRAEAQAFYAQVGSWKKDLGLFVAKYILPELGTILATWKLAKP